MFIILQTSYFIIYNHTSSHIIILGPYCHPYLYFLWIQISTQSSPIDSLSRSQNNPALLSLYLELQGSPTLPSSQSFQNCSKRVHMSEPIVSGNSQRPLLSSLAFASVRPLSSSQYTLTNTDSKADDYTREEVWLRWAHRSLLITRWRLRMIQPHASTSGRSADT